jgi:hypothetical protein
MGKSESGTPADKLALYEKLIAEFPDVGRKGTSMPYTSLKGHMFSFLTKEGKLALRLGEEQRGAFLKKYKTKLCEQHGAVMREYVEVPDTLLKRTRELNKYFGQSLEYVGSLKPKPTKKVAGKKASGKKAGGKKKTGK